jgi:hypothetical protein
MKSFREELWFNIPGRRGFINIWNEDDTADIETMGMIRRFPRPVVSTDIFSHDSSI